MGALKLSYNESTSLTGHDEYGFLRVVAKNGDTIKQSSNYFPFGAPMPGRQYNNGTYRYGFNGKENDNEVKGTGNQQDYGMRIYDPRLGKFLSIDPLFKMYPYKSPYDFAENTPIMASDLDGGEMQIDNMGKKQYGPIDIALINAENLKKYPELNQKKANSNPSNPDNNQKQGIELQAAAETVVDMTEVVNENFVKSYQFTRTGKVNTRSDGMTKVAKELNGKGGSGKFIGRVSKALDAYKITGDLVNIVIAEDEKEKKEAIDETKSDIGGILLDAGLSRINPVLTAFTLWDDYYSSDKQFILTQLNDYRSKANAEGASQADRDKLYNWEKKYSSVIYGDAPKEQPEFKQGKK